MKETIKLKNPIMINGAEVSEIQCDMDAITPPLYAQAEAMKKQAAGLKNVAIVPAVEFDFSLHMYLGFAGAIAANSALTFEDLERLHGADIMKFSKLGRDFTLGVEASQENNSGTVSGITQEPTTPQPLNSTNDQ